jgi:hypothetical protein
LRTIIGILIALPSAIHAQTEKAEFADLGEAAWRCAYLAAWSADYQEAKRLFSIGEQAYRVWISMPTASMPPSTQRHDEPTAEITPEHRERITALQAAQRRVKAQYLGSWESEISPSPDFKLGQIWQEITDEARRNIRTHTDWDAEAVRTLEQENCKWIK